MVKIGSLTVLAVPVVATEHGQRLPDCAKTFQVPEQHRVCYPNEEIGMCRDTHQSNEALINLCQEICGTNVALTIGTYEAGVDKSFMNMICLDNDVLDTGVTVMKRDDALLRKCNDLHTSFGRVQKYTGDFVAKFDMVRIKQLEFAEKAQSRTQDMQDAIAKELNGNVAEAKRGDKIPMLQEAIRLAREEYMPKEADKLRVINAVKDVRETGQVLFANLADEMEKIRTFKDECLLLLNIPISNQAAQMVDICANNADYCMDEAATDRDEYLQMARDATKHVGCCCAGIPGVFGSAVAPGTGLDPSCSPFRRLGSDGEAAANRGLSEEQAGGTADGGTADVCMYAKDRVLRESKDVISEMQTAGLSTAAVTRLTDEMKECDRRLADEPDQWKTSANQTEPSSLQRSLQAVPCFPSSEPFAEHWTAADQAQLNLSPTEQQIDGFCSELGLPKMQEMCNDFCGKGSTSLLIGTEQAGFSHKEADAVCMAIGEAEMDPVIARQCLEKASNMKKHISLAGKLVEALDDVRVKKLLVEAFAIQEAKDLNEWIKTEAEGLFKNMNIGVDEADLLMEFAARTNAITGGALRLDRLNTAIEMVLETADKLEASIEEMVAETNEFMAQCSRLTTGYDADGHYLLDLCRVRGDLCLDTDLAFRTTCCCAYNPLVSYGSEPSLTSTIPGLAALQGDRRLEDSRRLQPVGNSPEETLLDSICDLAADEVRSIWDEAKEELSKTGQEQLLEQYKSKLRAEYDLCPDLEGDQNTDQDGSDSPKADDNTNDTTESSDASGLRTSCTVAAVGWWLALSQ